MILIADSGSTKTTWRFIENASSGFEFVTGGYNPCYTDGNSLSRMLEPVLTEKGFEGNGVEKVAYYGAGVYENNKYMIRNALSAVFPKAQIETCSDLVGAARALLGDSGGFAAILGTGSNSCLYDGKEIVRHIHSLGFMLGDEGSGGYMGKRLIGDYIRGYMPEDVRTAFRDACKLSRDELIAQIHASTAPNRYCASFTRFLTGELAGHEYLEQRIVGDSFRDFFRNVVSHYPAYRDYAFNSVGSVGWIFRDRLTAVADEFGMTTGCVIADPMAGLAKWELKHAGMGV
ncbi:MAG: N-acetylglucosamine kinase [Tannerella sp.]|jgi:N-acetylglucosamine kinase-like BadF-type ATPase|nr:N-acetylglucosamine kinase [Tannerella sp.]